MPIKLSAFFLHNIWNSQLYILVLSYRIYQNKMKYNKEIFLPFRDRLVVALGSISKSRNKPIVNKIKDASEVISKIIDYMHYYDDFESQVNGQLNKVNIRLDFIRNLESEIKEMLMKRSLAKVDAKCKEIVEVRNVHQYSKLIKQQKFLSYCLFLDNSELEMLLSDIENAKRK
jgi:hypothetical protein